MADEEKASEQSDPQEKLRQALEKFTTDSAEMLGEIGQAAADVKATKEALLKDQEELTKAKDEAAKSTEKIQEFYASLFEKSEGKDKPIVKAIPEAEKSIIKAKENIDALEARATAYVEALLGKTGPDGLPILGIKDDLEKKAKELEELHSKIFKKPDPNRLALSEEVGAFLEDFTKKKSELEQLLIDAGSYHDELLGEEVDGKHVNGIKGDVEEYVQQLDDLLGANRKKQEELLKKVEDLLQGASTAALATASNEHKTSFDDANKTWTWVFFGSIGVIMAVPLMAVLWPSMLALPWWEQLLVRLPVVGGAVTLAWYASKQRSQNKRLQQEYAYKEDVAKIYYALKKEIENMGESKLGEQLREDVIKLLVKSVDFNPSSTLDSKSHNDKGPLVELVKEVKAGVVDIGKIMKVPGVQ